MNFKTLSVKNYKHLKEEIIIDFNSGFGKRDLGFENPMLKLNNKQNLLNKIGIIGKNGIGKTILLEAICNLKFLRNFNQRNEKINSKIEYNIEMCTDKYDITYYIHNDVEYITISTFSKTSKIYKISSLDLSELANDENLNFTNFYNLSHNDVTYLIKSINNSEDNIKKEALLKLLDLKYTKKDKKIKIILNKEDKFTYEKTILNNIFETFEKIFLLDANHGYFTKNTNTEVDYNKYNILEYLNNNPLELENISKIISSLDSNIGNLKIVKKDVNLKNYDNLTILFTKNKIDFFEFASSGTKKLFGILSYLSLLKNFKPSLILLDELDAMFNTYVIKKVLSNNIWNQTQLIFTFHNTNILSKNFNILRPDQINFFRESDNIYELTSLIEFENYSKYLRNNSLISDILDDVFETEPVI